jgi:hypothetical protein
MLCTSKDREEKEPGFARLEQHEKNLILNASTIPPFNDPAETPTEFYTSLLSEKSQLKAEDMLTHHFLIDKVSFTQPKCRFHQLFLEWRLFLDTTRFPIRNKHLLLPRIQIPQCS